MRKEQYKLLEMQKRNEEYVRKRRLLARQKSEEEQNRKRRHILTTHHESQSGISYSNPYHNHNCQKFSHDF